MPHDANNSSEWIAVVAREPGAVLLQRAPLSTCVGRSILFRNPTRVIEARRLAEVRDALAEAEGALAHGYHVAGYISYEAGFAWEPSLGGLPPAQANETPLLWLGCYPRPEVREDRGFPEVPRIAMPHLQLRYSLSSEEYSRKVESIRALIAAGETYQANLTMDVQWSTDENPAEMYERLLRVQPVRYAALLHPEPDWHLLSLSPELFFAREGEHIVTRPMKGTAFPGLDAAEARAQKAWLHADEKNRAENLMIVDLLRNDLGRICQMGSVEVTKLFEVESYPTVLQMTSTIEGRLRNDVGYAELFAALFPSGSIIGAPKIHTMRLLHALENRARGVYTGAIGYMAPNDVAEFNVAIRTVSLCKGNARFGVGAGIVYDSDPAREYEECRTKARFLELEPDPEFQLIETLLLQDGTYLMLEEHLERMSQSAEYFGMAFNAAQVEAALQDARRASTPENRARVRLLLDRQGAVSWTTAPLDPEEVSPVVLVLSQYRTDPADRFLRHKTTHRALYDDALREAQKQGFADVLFRNTRGEFSECAVHNLIVSLDGQWLTPPISSGLLPGVYRRHMLLEGKISERVFGFNDLLRADAVSVCNSVRGLRRVSRIVDRSDCGDGFTTVWSDKQPAESKN